jgi:hypothetical protein
MISEPDSDRGQLSYSSVVERIDKWNIIHSYFEIETV